MGRLQRALAAATMVAVTGTGLLALAEPAAAASLRVSPSTGLDPNGQTISVSGSGFDPNRNNKFGVYVVFGPRRADYYTNSGNYGAALWVHPGGAGSGQARMSPSGTFSVSLTVKARYTDSSGRAVDCTRTRCYVMTFAAHGVPDRSQDTLIPVSFKGSDSPNPGGSDPDNPGSGGSGSGGSTGPGGGSSPSPSAGALTGSSASPLPSPGMAAPAAGAAGAATPLAVQPFRQTASGPPAQSPWPFWLTTAVLVAAGLTARRLIIRRRLRRT